MRLTFERLQKAVFEQVGFSRLILLIRSFDLVVERVDPIVSQ